MHHLMSGNVLCFNPDLHHFLPFIESTLCSAPTWTSIHKLANIVGVRNCCVMHGSSVQRGKRKGWAHLSRGMCHGYLLISSGPNATGLRIVPKAMDICLYPMA